MNILFVSESLWMEGVVYDLHILAEGLSLRGHRVHAVDPGCHHTIAPFRDTISRVFEAASVSLVSPRYRPGFPLYLLTDRIGLARDVYGIQQRYKFIKSILDEHPIDIVVLYSGVRLGAQAVILARQRGIPIVFRNVDKLYNLFPSRMGRFAAKQVEKYVYPKVDKALALTPRYGAYLEELGAKKASLDQLVFPINLHDFKPAPPDAKLRQEWGISRDDKVIVFVGTLYRFGGVADLVRAFSGVSEAVTDAKLLVVGDGPAREDVERAIDESGLRGRVRVTGYRPFSEMAQFINLATVCVNSFPIVARTKDIFSAKIIQYLACGKPTVSSALPGITTLLDAETTGVVYADSPDGLWQEIVGLLKDPERCAGLGRKGRRYVEEVHAHDRVTERLEHVLKEVVSQ